MTGFRYCSDNLKIRRLELKSFLNGRLQSLERLERLNSFNADTTRIILTNKSYNNVEIESDSVIYCDPPYLGTKRYKSEFDYDKFYEWLRNNPNKIYISEYSMPDDFCEIYRVNRTVVFDYKVSKISVEKLYSNKPVPNPLEF